MGANKFRLVTRSDFDGLVCAMLLKELDLIDDIKFVHPKDMQDGTVVISDRDITTNLPYVRGVHLAFDHHLSETIRLDKKPDNHVIEPEAPSAARVVFNHYGGKKAFPRISDEIMAAVDKGDAAQFSRDDILNPQGWVLLNFLMDARTGLGRFKTFRISNYELMMRLIDFCREHDAAGVLALPDVNERVELYNSHRDKAEAQIKLCTKAHKNFGVLDLRNEDTIYAANRFLVYALFPEINISAHVMWGLNRQNTVFAVGKSVLNRTSRTNIGELMLSYGGGGHQNAGTCQVANADAERVLGELIGRITADG